MGLPEDHLPQLSIEIPAEGARLGADLDVPDGALGLVVFAHGSGSSRKSPRNRQVALTLRESGLATLLLDLLSPEEDALELRGARLRFDLPLLARRLAAACDAVRARPGLAELPLGYFGASTGAGAALIAAGLRPQDVRAVVSRGGRPDLAGDWLQRVRAPTRLIVGGHDEQVLEWNRWALGRLQCTKDLAVVPGATHLFEQPGALEHVARLSADWFVRYLGRCEASRQPASGDAARA